MIGMGRNGAVFDSAIVRVMLRGSQAVSMLYEMQVSI